MHKHLPKLHEVSRAVILQVLAVVICAFLVSKNPAVKDWLARNSL